MDQNIYSEDLTQKLSSQLLANQQKYSISNTKAQNRYKYKGSLVMSSQIMEKIRTLSIKSPVAR